MYYVISYGRAGCADHLGVDEPASTLNEARALVREAGIDIGDETLRWAGIDDDFAGMIPVEAWHESHDPGCGGVQIYQEAPAGIRDKPCLMSSGRQPGRRAICWIPRATLAG